jgi:hypothetical protein
MKKLILIGVALVLMAGLVVGLGIANAGEGVPSSKATSQVKDIVIISETDADVTWQPILQTTLKTANQKDLFIDVSLECGLYTKTKAHTKYVDGTLVEDTTTASSAIEVRVLVDGHPVYPADVTFAAREQTLTVKLQGILGACSPGQPIVIPGLCVVGEEYVELILATMEANSFNFVCADVDSGVHEITVEAAINLDADEDAEAKATIGHGTITVEEVRMIKGAEWLVLE